MKHETNVYVIRKTARQISFGLDGIAASRSVRHLAFVLEHDAGDQDMVLKIIANSRQILDNIDAKAAKRLRIPTPESIRSLGLLIVPAASTTSLSAANPLPRRL